MIFYFSIPLRWYFSTILIYSLTDAILDVSIIPINGRLSANCEENMENRASINDLIEKLAETHHLDRDEWVRLFSEKNTEIQDQMAERARTVSIRQFGHEIYTRGLIEFTSWCRNDCYYCGIRRSNREAQRYRLTREDILQCCKSGYELGFRTFVLQGGEDPGFGEEALLDIVSAIKTRHPDCAVTLSVGEASRETYQRYFYAGAERFLLRHETAAPEHYRLLHPASMSPENRKRCLWDLKEIGFQTGTGFMVGSPGQTPEFLAADMAFIEELQPQMVGIGPFVPHRSTPFAGQPGGTVAETLFCISALRLMLPQALIPATTALGTIAPDGREQGILAGANVVMPNLSPLSVRKKYELYDHKICTGEEAAECRGCLEQRMRSIGYTLAVSRGDHPQMRK